MDVFLGGGWIHHGPWNVDEWGAKVWSRQRWTLDCGHMGNYTVDSTAQLQKSSTDMHSSFTFFRSTSPRAALTSLKTSEWLLPIHSQISPRDLWAANARENRASIWPWPWWTQLEMLFRPRKLTWAWQTAPLGWKCVSFILLNTRNMECFWCSYLLLLISRWTCFSRKDPNGGRSNSKHVYPVMICRCAHMRQPLC